MTGLTPLAAHHIFIISVLGKGVKGNFAQIFSAAKWEKSLLYASSSYRTDIKIITAALSEKVFHLFDEFV